MTPNVIITLIVMVVFVAIFLLITRLNKTMPKSVAGLKYTQPTVNQPGRDWFYYVNPGSRNRQINGVGVTCSIPFIVRLEPLDRFDRLAAQLGFANPVLTGDPEFDAQVYSYSTNAFFYQSLGINAELRRSILAIFQRGYASIFCDGNQLVACGGRGAAIYNRYNVDEEPSIALAEQLKGIQRALQKVQADSNEVTLSRAAGIDKLFRRCLSVIMIIGISAAFICVSGPSSQLVSVVPLLKLTGIAAAGSILAALIALRALVSDTPYGADIFKVFVQYGIIAIYSVLFTGLFIGNMQCDKAMPVALTQRIINKYYTTGKHNSHTYYVSVEGWGAAKKIDIRVDQYRYNYLKPGQKMLIFSHPGYYNIEWISLP